MKLWISGKAYINSEVKNICVEFDRKIKGIKPTCKPDISLPQGTLLLPGAIDLHTHIRGLKMAYKEDVVSGTSEASYGGITLVGDMPNTIPYINNVETINSKLKEFEYYSRVDYVIYSGVTKEFEKVDKSPVGGYKIFPEDLEKEETYEVLKSKKLKILHPEVPIALRGNRRLRLNRWYEIGALFYLEKYQRIHITHATNIDTIRLAKKMGFTVDLTPHHILLTDEKNCINKVNPPIRSITERLQLLQGLYEVDAIVSDHAPHANFEKSYPYEICPPGVALVSFTVPFLFSLVKKDILSLDDAVRVISINPAKILGLPYGEIKEGNYANFTIIEFKHWRYSTKYSKVTETPLDNFPLEASVYMTIVQGKVSNYQGEVFPIKGINPFSDMA
ncbi:dihydroorotase [Sulfolobus sp. A20]|uniref:dihydroorotase n=1 Tax=Sulfolobaceae TaxID=118883 RepID=UPI000845CE85|nr:MULTISPECIES: dihydroorotase [unclassified Sulfolobus]TRM76482.1 dihydroorotase [Sulfolobus sp. E5]TRM76914.1 dihydroorotase [Sulfolobus sp. B5]TRM87749.1 dihydroorotase [Sulfolobus sp. C3]TRN00242.1 dihydroorotase [Sulfolobus sp. E1]AOL15853.1 dihydroorotase [Sulfolobus sp. A20]